MPSTQSSILGLNIGIHRKDSPETATSQRRCCKNAGRSGYAKKENLLPRGKMPCGKNFREYSAKPSSTSETQMDSATIRSNWLVRICSSVRSPSLSSLSPLPPSPVGLRIWAAAYCTPSRSAPPPCGHRGGAHQPQSDALPTPRSKIPVLSLQTHLRIFASRYRAISNSARAHLETASMSSVAAVRIILAAQTRTPVS